MEPQCRRVLLVEDEQLLRVIFAEALAEEGFQVVEARSGDEAIRLISDPDRFEAVVTDIDMPGTNDGVAVGRFVRQHDPSIPVVYISGRPDAVRAAEPLGKREVFLRKPCTPLQLADTLRKLLADPAIL